MNPRENISKKYFIEGILLITLSMTNFAVLWLPGFSPITLFICAGFIYLLFSARDIFGRYSLKKIFLLTLPIYFIFSNILNIAESKFSSLLYSLFFIAIFFSLNSNLQNVPFHFFVRISKIVIYISLLGTVLAQIQGALNLSVFDFFSTFISLDEKSGASRYMGFTSEPSYASFVILAAYYVILLWQLSVKKFYLAPTLAVLYQLFFFGSVYGYLIVVVIGSWLITHLYKNRNNRSIIISVLILLIVGVAVLVEWSSDSRIINLLSNIFSMKMDLATFNEIDSSAWMRIAPFFTYVEKFNISDIHTYIGFGSSAANKFFSFEFADHIGDAVGTREGLLELGFFPAFIYAYGLLGILICYLLIFKKIFKTFFFVETSFVFLMLLNANFNTQLFWYIVIFMLIASSFHSTKFALNIKLPPEKLYKK